jgi:hypothetical protein
LFLTASVSLPAKCADGTKVPCGIFQSGTPLIRQVDHFSAAKMRAQFCNRTFRNHCFTSLTADRAGYPTECGVTGRMERQALN